MPRIVRLLLSLVFVLLVATPVPASEDAPPPPLATVAWVDAAVADVWDAFTTADGWKKFGIPLVDVDFRVGGKIRTHYDPKGTLGDARTIENTILAYEPQRMLTIKATKAPEGFPFPAHLLDRTWSVFTFRDLGSGRTRVVIRGYGYGDDADSRRMRAFFKRGNAWSLQQLASRLARKRDDAEKALRPIELGIAVPAPLPEVFRAWTTEDGIRDFLGVESKVALEVGGSYEIYLDKDGKPGSRGSEGCVIQTWIPDRLLAFSWNAPPALPHARKRFTRVVLEFEREDAHHTRVWLTHTGFADAARTDPSHAEEYAKARAHLKEAWPRVLAALAKHFTQPPR